MSEVKLYLITLNESELEGVQTFRELNSVHAYMEEQSVNKRSHLLHSGFFRPNLQSPFNFPEIVDGKVLYSGSIKWALPADYKSPNTPTCNININGNITPCYLAQNKWGYELEDDQLIISEPLLASVGGANEKQIFVGKDNDEEPEGWFKELKYQFPTLYERASNLGAYNDETYLRIEKDLPISINAEIGKFRFSLLMLEINRLDPSQLASICPSWLQNSSVTVLDTPIRVTNVLRQNNIERIIQLKSFSIWDIHHFPSMGKKSVRDLCQAIIIKVENTPTDFCYVSSNKEPNIHCKNIDLINENESSLVNVRLIDQLNRTFERLNENHSIILKSRLGYFPGGARTLEEIGKELGVTRERVRQLQKKVTQKIIDTEYWDDEIALRIGKLLLDRDAPLILETLDVEDAWFSGFDWNFVFLSHVIKVYSEKEINVINADGRNIICRISQNKWDDLLKDLRIELKNKSEDKQWSREDIQQYLETSLSEHGAIELLSILNEFFSPFLQYEGDDSNSILVSYGNSAESLVDAVLSQSDTPLHYSEITRRAMVIAERKVEIRRIHNACDKEDIFLFDRGTYGLIGHCPLPLLKREEIRKIVENVLYQGPINKQWHSKNIIKEVLKTFSDVPNKIDPYVLRMCIGGSDKILFLGRMMWARSDSGMEKNDRVKINDSFIKILEEEGKPLSGSELKRRLSGVRDIPKSTQFFEDEQIVSVGANVWGLRKWRI
jgi:hypothetical protein